MTTQQAFSYFTSDRGSAKETRPATFAYFLPTRIFLVSNNVARKETIRIKTYNITWIGRSGRRSSTLLRNTLCLSLYATFRKDACCRTRRCKILITRFRLRAIEAIGAIAERERGTRSIFRRGIRGHELEGV